MADVTVTAASVRPLGGAKIRRGTAGGDGTIGNAVYLDGANGWKVADADAEASSQAKGIAVAKGAEGETTFADGDPIDIAVFGPVEGFTSMTPGAVAYVSTTAGDIDQTKGTTSGDYPYVIGWAEQATVLFVQPQAVVPTVI